jgi:hypothetical protein
MRTPAPLCGSTSAWGGNILASLLLLAAVAMPAAAGPADSVQVENVPPTATYYRYEGGMVLETQEDVAAVLTALPPGPVEVGKTLVIRGTKLTGALLAPLLTKVVVVDGPLLVSDTRLTSLSSLSQLAAVNGPVEVSGNPHLSSVCGLAALTTRAAVGIRVCAGVDGGQRAIESGFAIFSNGPLVFVPQHLASGRGVRDAAVTPVDCSALVEETTAAARVANDGGREIELAHAARSNREAQVRPPPPRTSLPRARAYTLSVPHMMHHEHHITLCHSTFSSFCLVCPRIPGTTNPVGGTRNREVDQQFSLVCRHPQQLQLCPPPTV